MQEKQKQVLFVAPSAYPLGGVAVWLDYLCAGLSEEGWQTQVALATGRWHDAARYIEQYPSLPAHPVKNPTGSVEGRIRALSHVIESKGPDVVVGVNIADTYAAARRLRTKGVPTRVVMSLHGISADLLGDVAREVGVLDGVVATNRLACRLAQDFSGMDAGRVFYAPYGVDTDRLSALPRESSGPKLRIAWVGRLEQEQKQVSDLSGILAHMDAMGVDYVLRIAGDGPDRSSLMERLRTWLDSRRVEYLGALPATEIGRVVYAKSDALLLTSSWETGPIVIWEAMASGVAVVSSRYVGSGLEGALCHEGNSLLYPVGDCDEAARQLARLANGTFRQRILEGGRQLVRTRYSISRSVRTWARCLDAVNKLTGKPVEPEDNYPAPSGRLDRWLGVRPAESVRKALSIHFEHREPGSEWPHTRVDGSAIQQKLLSLAGQLDGHD